MGAAVNCDYFSPAASKTTMAKSTGPPRIVLLGGTYQDYLSRSNTNTLCGRYSAILMPYAIDPAASAADSVPDNVVRLIHAAMQEGVPTAFLKWHQGMRGGVARR